MLSQRSGPADVELVTEDSHVSFGSHEEEDDAFCAALFALTLLATSPASLPYANVLDRFNGDPLFIPERQPSEIYLLK